MTGKSKRRPEYEVGRGKPPKDTQWEKGHSGNLAGPPKRDEIAARDLIDMILREKIPGYENGKAISITRLKACARTVVDRGIAGDSVCEDLLIKIEGPDLAARAKGVRFIDVKTEDEIPARTREFLARERKRRAPRRPDRDQPGKRRGRPRDDEPFPELVKRELNRKIQVQENGKTMRITKREAWIRRVINSVIKGDPRSLRTFIRIAKPTESAQDGGLLFYVIGGDPE